MERHLAWDGCANVRDLGGLPAAGGRTIRRGALVRADALHRLSAAGWRALEAHGVRTLVDLRNDDELRPDTAPRPPGLTTVRVPLDGIEHRDFWDAWDRDWRFGTPLYYRPFLDRFPDRVAQAVTAVARAEPGGVVVHCSVGRDRTGLIAALLLALAGVAHEDIADDYGLSAPDDGAAEGFARAGTSARDVLLELLTGLDVAACLREAGVVEGDLIALRMRLTG